MFAERRMRKTLKNATPLETERLILRYIEPGDAEDMFEYATQDEVCKYLLWSPHINIEATKGYIESLQKRYAKGLYGDWALVLKSENKMIGTCGYASVNSSELSCEIGYVLSPKYRKNGYMTECVNALLSLTFDSMGLERAELRIIKENTASRALAERTGFELASVNEGEMEIKGKYCDIAHYVLTKEKYKSIKK